jgi:protein TonB
VPVPVAKPAARKPAPAPRSVAPPAAPATVAAAPQFAPQPEPVPAPAPAQAAPPPPVAVAPSPDARAVARYRQEILDAARRGKRYPRVAIDNAWEGEVGVQMSVGARGRIAALRVTRSSGHAVLDREALRLFESAKSRVAIPRELRGQAFEIEVEVVYSLRAQRSG